MKSDGKIQNDIASIFFFGIYYIVSVYIISIPIISYIIEFSLSVCEYVSMYVGPE